MLCYAFWSVCHMPTFVFPGVQIAQKVEKFVKKINVIHEGGIMMIYQLTCAVRQFCS